MNIGVGVSSEKDSNYGYYWGLDSYKKAKEFGFTHVDFGMLCDQSKPVYTLPEEEAMKLLLAEKAALDAAGLKISQSHAPCFPRANPFTEEEKVGIMELTKKAIRFSKAIDCPYLVVHPIMINGWSERGSELAKDTFEKNVNMLRELSDYAAEYDVVLCYENMPCIGFSISHPHEVLEVVKAVNHPNLGICFDSGHTTAFKSPLSVGEEIRGLGDYLKVLHIHDTYGNADQHNFPGMGATDWKEVRAALEDIGYKGVFSLEINVLHRFSEKVFEQACRLSYAMADEIING